MIRLLEKMFGCFHQWSQWNKETIHIYYGGPAICMIKARYCKKCGDDQTKEIWE